MPHAPVLLVHGFASSFERNWREPGWVDLLREGGRDVIGVDLLGHGQAPKPHDPEAYGDLGGRARDALPHTAVDGVGFSLGAGVLLGLALEDPNRFSRLVLLGIGENVFRGGDPEPIARAVEGTGPADHPLARAFARFASNPGNDPAALAACLRRPAMPLEPAALAAVTCPVLVVLGDRDFNGPGEPLVDALPDARLHLLRNVDHLATPNDFGCIDATLSFLGVA